MSTYYLGLDLGTSSVKGILRNAAGDSIKGKASYSDKTVTGWKHAIAGMLADMTATLNARGGEIGAVALSSQVGTYVVDGKDVIGWQSAAGRSACRIPISFPIRCQGFCIFNDITRMRTRC